MVSIDAGTPPAGMKFESWTSGDVTFADSSSASTTFTMPVKNVIVVATWMVAVPTITTTSLPDCQIDESYQQRLAATGDTPITWSIAAGRLPDGFTLSPDGVISGTPVWEGGSLVDTYPITVQASNQAGSDTKSLTLSIVAPADTPTIFGPDYIGLVEGYGTVTIPYAVGPSGVSDTASVDAAAGSLVTWYAHSGLKIDPGLTTGNYGVVLTAGSASGPQARMLVWIVVMPVPISPVLTGPSAQTLYTGYAATSSARFDITGTGTVVVTKTSGDPAITWNDTTHRLDIASGLANGTYPVTLTASNGVSPDFTTTFILTVASPPAPTVLSVTVTPAAASPAPGDTTQFAATVAGSNGPASDVTWAVSGASSAGTSISSSGLLTLGSDETSALLTVTATSVADTTKSGTALVAVNQPTMAPTLAGPASLSLVEGYAATSTSVFTVTGTAPVSVMKTTGNAAITWNDGTKKLDIAAGLAAGTYPVTLAASNGTPPDATTTFTLTVNPAPVAPTITGPTALALAAAYAPTSSDVFTVTGTAPVTVTKTTGAPEITWNDATKRLDIAPGLGLGAHLVTLTASNGVPPDATIDFTVTVYGPPQPTAPTITGPTAQTVSEG